MSGWHIANARDVQWLDGVEHEIAVPKEAYAPFVEDEPVPFREFLP
jgi:hypothetical protein